MSKSFRMSKALLGLTVVLAAIPAVPGLATAGTTYIVATTGSDANPGTVSQPFKTIQHCADVAVAGDVCQVRAGTYRETVIVPHSGSSGSPIVFQNYGTEQAIISGTEPVTGWTLESGSIYYAPMNWDLADKNQIFAGGEMMTEARWPNNTGTLFQPTLSTAASSTTRTEIVDTAIPGGDDFWNGATIWSASGAGWQAKTTRVTDFEAATHKLTVTPFSTYVSANYDIKAGNTYFLSGIKGALDTPKEWWYDTANARLYLRAPGNVNPNTLTVEAKKRDLAFDLSGRSYVQLKGLQVFASTITTDDTSHHLLLQGLKGAYLSHSDLTDWDLAYTYQSNYGVLIKGHDNEVRDSEFAYSSAALVNVRGSNNKVVNNYLHDGNYQGNGTTHGLIQATGTGQLISYNTAHDAGRDVITLTGISKSRIDHNNFYNGGWLTKDLGLLYVQNTDGQNTEIDHNLLHDNKTIGYADGLYLDNSTNNFVIHHNVVWNIPGDGFRINTPSNYILFYNNTGFSNGGLKNWGAAFPTDMYGSQYYDNIFRDPLQLQATASAGSNILSSVNPLFVNTSASNFQLQSTSPAIDYGVSIPGINDGYVGSAPDAGAYEYGAAPWTAGHNFATPPTASFSAVNTPFMNRVVNGGFETGDFANWTLTGSATKTVNNDNAWQSETRNSRSQYYAARIQGNGGGVEQTITGLAPNTSYTLKAWAKLSSASEVVTIGATGFGGTDVSAAITGTGSAWLNNTVSFTTGASSTSATIYVSKTGGTGSAYVDDIGLQKSLAAADITPPTNPTGLNAPSKTATTVTLSWTGATDNVGVTNYDVYRSGSLVGTTTTATTFTVTGLTASTAYSFTVKARDAAGNVSSPSNTLNVTTSAGASDTTAPSAPTGLTSPSKTDTSVSLSWTASTDNVAVTAYDIYRGGSLAGSTAGATTYTATGLTASTAYSFTVKARDAAGNVSAASSALSVTTNAPAPSSLPSPWLTQDIGSVGVAGSATYSGGVYTVNGSGADIGGTADAFRFVYQPMSGDGSIVAKVVSMDNTNTGARAGVMMRESLDANSREMTVALSPTSGAKVIKRLSTGGTTATSGGSTAPAAPYWVKLTRTGNSLSGLISADGTTWTTFLTATVTMGTDIYVGLAVVSKDDAVLNASTFSDVTVVP
ncbi:fibronectin type III domain-containing protein [Cohnella sp. JJ-181]|uniref:fibronectin type III domain-containing protein n=1 Tax=Cohnella rhizoplanae TaxID=2974897 RepID=UPI0022FF97AB|nr:fibronectin type III domain-containing protein [Cohnella sp. JJ-181]CAI6083108.1 hypothetical protein COHCIP112018_03870 [Cohnella sp. JJ-181]